MARGGARPLSQRVRAPGYVRRRLGRVQVLIKRRPPWQAGAATAEALAASLNNVAHYGRLIAEGGPGGGPPLAHIYRAWSAAVAILEPSLREGVLADQLHPETVRRFTRFASHHPITLAVQAPRTPFIGGEDAGDDVAFLLWELFRGPAWARLKRCPRCGRWFADETKNRTQRWCSEDCHNRAWTRARRREAKHAQYRQQTMRRKRP